MSYDRFDDPDSPNPLDGEFWGAQSEWTPQRPPSTERSGLGATIGRWWNGLLGGSEPSGRAHGGSATRAALVADDVADRGIEFEAVPDAGSPAESQVGSQVDVDDDDAWTFEPEPVPTRRPGVDPLIARLGGLAVIVTLAAPLVVGFTSSGSDSSADADRMVTVAPTTSASVESPPSVAPSTLPAPAATPAAPASAPASSALDETSTTGTADGVGEAEPSATVPEVASLQAAQEPEPATTTPAVTTPPCGSRYELAGGDYWIRIADAADVSLADLLAVNEASVDTVLVPGRSICLPVGASTPAPPVTTPATTPAPAPTAPSNPTTSRPTPATTVPAPTTTAAPRPAAVPPSQAADIIRSVWPDDLEERALEIAWRESNHRSNVNNWCCYGLFQIHWTAHRSWLAGFGVTSASQLYDPTVNATVAYALYQRAGGWGPWGG
jgi:LysM repeat protein